MSLSIEVSKLSTGTLEHVALSRLAPSTTNPRKVFTGIEDLAASIKEMGLAQPMLVRAVGTFAYVEQNEDGTWRAEVDGSLRQNRIIQNFTQGEQDQLAMEAQAWAQAWNAMHAPLEVVIGGRRFRACKLAGLETVPVIIAKLTDEEAMDLQVIENLQREDVHPLEEAEGYRALKKAPAIIAQRVGKDLAYVVQRLQLLKLELLAKEMYASGHIELAHAITLAKLTPADQLRAVKNMMGWNQLPAKTDWLEAMKSAIKRHQDVDYRLIRDTPATLDKWVRDNVFLILKQAPWDLKDAALLPEAGACTDCPKRTGSNMALFQQLTSQDETCTDGKCYEAKQKAYIAASVQLAQDKGGKLLKLTNKSSHQPIKDERKPIGEGQWLKAKRGTCKDIQKGIFLDNSSRWRGEMHRAGDTLLVCINQGCTVHKHTVDTPSPTGAPAPRVSEEQREAEREAAVTVERVVYHEIFEATKATLTPGNKHITALLLQAAGSRDVFFLCDQLGLSGLLEPAALDEDGQEDYDARQDREEAAFQLLVDWMATANEESMERFAFLVRYAKVGVLNGWQLMHDKKRSRADLWQFASELGVDAAPIAQRVETQQKQKAAADRKAEAAAAKAAKKGGK